jgi:hypothetical protein
MSAVENIDDFVIPFVIRLGSSTLSFAVFSLWDCCELDIAKLARNREEAACCFDINLFR